MRRSGIRLTRPNTARLLALLAGVLVLCFASVPHAEAQSATTLTQSNYRWYQNRNGERPFVALEGENTPVTGIGQGEVIRLRINLLVGNDTLAENALSLKLQYAESPSGPWSDVGQIGSESVWRGYNNNSPSDGNTLGRWSRLLGSSDVTESYEEENPSSPNPRSALAGQYAEWDWVLENHSAPAGTTYYFRLVATDGTPLDGYVRYPQVTTAPPPSLTQDAYRWYKNRNGITPIQALQDEDQLHIAPSLSDQYRLRINVLATGGPLAAGSQAFKLQYATSVSGPWSDVGPIGSSSVWRGYNNPNPDDGSTLTAIPKRLSSSDVTESYEEENPSILNPRTIGAGQRGEWDWVLESNSAVPNTTYYFRMVKADGTPLEGYIRYPAIFFPGTSVLTQRDYRWYQNSDSATPSLPLASENTVLGATSPNAIYRLRVNILSAGAPLSKESKAFKLQYATAISGPWTDVGGLGSSSIWRGYDNPSPADGSQLASSSKLLSTTDVAESYEEENPSSLNPRSINANRIGEWDWVLEANGIAVNTTYYFRMVEQDGTPLSYAHYPAIDTYSMNAPPSVDAVTLLATEMTPQLQYDVSITVSDANTINDLTSLEFKLYYQDQGGVPSETQFDDAVADVHNCAVITWTPDDPGGTTYTGSTTFAPTGTTWAFLPATVPNGPGDFNQTSFTFHFTLTIGKVATQTTGPALWHLAARATDLGGSSDFNYDPEGAAMSFYGEISGLSGVSVDWGTMNPGTDFASTERMLNATVVYVANGHYEKKVKSSPTWSGADNVAMLDPTGECAGSNQFSLKAYITNDLDQAILVDADGITVDSSGGQTGEAGDTISTNTLWLKLAPVFAKDTYTGTITYIISNEP